LGSATLPSIIVFNADEMLLLVASMTRQNQGACTGGGVQCANEQSGFDFAGGLPVCGPLNAEVESVIRNVDLRELDVSMEHTLNVLCLQAWLS
jgi:hypothetical protein